MITRGLRLITHFNAGVFRGFGTLPDHETLKMPALSPTMTEGTIVKWLKKEGDKVKPGEIMFEVETDKATVGYEVQDEVFLAKILEEEGKNKIQLGHPVAILVSKLDRVAAFKDYSPSSEPSTPVSASEPKITEEKPVLPSNPIVVEAKKTEEKPTSAQPANNRVFISPIAKNLAKEKEIDYKTLAGSGPNGRIVKADILAFESKKQDLKKQDLKQQESKKPVEALPITEDRAGYKDVPHSSIRKVTAARLLESKQNIPHFYLTIDCKVDKLLSLRQALNEISEVKISVNDLIIKASALACVKVPEVNSSWTDEAIRTYTNVDVSIAVQTPKGLITPIITNAHHKRLGEIAKEAKELAAIAKEGKLQPNQFIGGTFTISNLGMFGIKEFSAIINPPQACILAVGASEGKVVLSGESFKVENFLTVTLSCDHRVVDGAVGASWLKVFKGYLEEPYTMLL